MERFTILGNHSADDMILRGEAYFLRSLLGIILICLSTQTFADEALVSLFAGMGQHHQESMTDSKTIPQGQAFGASFGRRMNYYEFELTLSKGTYTSDIEHDGRSNTINHDQLQFSIALNFYLVKNIYLRIGYGLTDIEQSTETKVSGASGAGLEEEYGLVRDKITGLVLGGGYAIVQTSSIQVYVQFEHHVMSEISASQNLATAGVRFYY